MEDWRSTIPFYILDGKYPDAVVTGVLKRAGRLPLRIVAGKYRSRPLLSLPGLDIRPTSDRLRETLFNVLCAGNPQALEGSIWFDLFAGTGAVGIEALSRGAAHVTFVESDPKAAALIQKNLAALQITSGFVVTRSKVAAALSRLADHAAREIFIFLDPPYRLQAAYHETLTSLSTSSLLGPKTVVIAEHERHFDPGEAFGKLHRYRKLEQGDAVLGFYQLDTSKP